MEKKSMIGIILIISISIFLLSYVLMGDESTGYFEKTRLGVKSGNPDVYANIANISEEFYKKPEFYPWYDSYKNKTNEKQTGTYGYGAYPAEVSYNVKGLKAGQFLDVYTFVHASYEVGNYQGLSLSFNSQDYELFETNTEPSEILLFPVPLDSINMSSNWTYRIKMRITAIKDIPEGRYVFKLIAGQPSPEKQREYRNMTGNYTNVGMIQPGKFFDFVLYAYK